MGPTGHRSRLRGGALLLLAGLWLVGLPAAAAGSDESASPGVAPAAPGAPAVEADDAQADAVGGPSNDGRRENGAIEFFIRGGVFMWPLLFCAILGLGTILERLLTFQRAHTKTRLLMAAVVAALKESGVDAAKEICLRARGPIAAILHAGLLKVDRGPAAVERAIDNSGALEMAFLQRGLIILPTVANIAPLLGFLGTVSGLIHACEAIASVDQVSAKIVASGIGEALITMLCGLAIAIPMQGMYNYFVSRIDQFVAEMEETAVELLDTLTDMSAAPRA